MKRVTLAGKNPLELNANFAGVNPFLLASRGKTGIKTSDVVTAEPFSSLFFIREEVLEAIASSMAERGYDPSQPVVIWKEKNVLIDGHTRLKAAEKAGITFIPAVYASFENEEEVIDYMHALQFARRNVTDADLIKLVSAALKKYEKRYGEGSKADFLARRFSGLSAAKAKKTLIVLEKGDKKLVESVENGEESINGAYKKLNPPSGGRAKKVRANFLKTDKPGPVFRADETGAFYGIGQGRKEEEMIFKLPDFLNSVRVRKAFLKIINEEIMRQTPAKSGAGETQRDTEVPKRN